MLNEPKQEQPLTQVLKVQTLEVQRLQDAAVKLRTRLSPLCDSRPRAVSEGKKDVPLPGEASSEICKTIHANTQVVSETAEVVLLLLGALEI